VARQPAFPRKQRTREHIIADLSMNHVERLILEQGHVMERIGSDYGYDLLMMTFDEQGYSEPDYIRLQLKATESLNSEGNDYYVHDLDIRDYNLWMQEWFPVFLVLYDASRRTACWLFIQHYFELKPQRTPRSGAKTVRVRVPASQKLTGKAIAQMRTWKHEFRRKTSGG
jgi:hypothetical protein